MVKEWIRYLAWAPLKQCNQLKLLIHLCHAGEIEQRIACVYSELARILSFPSREAVRLALLGLQRLGCIQLEVGRGEAIVQILDPTRVVNQHAPGALSKRASQARWADAHAKCKPSKQLSLDLQPSPPVIVTKDSSLDSLATSQEVRKETSLQTGNEWMQASLRRMGLQPESVPKQPSQNPDSSQAVMQRLRKLPAERQAFVKLQAKGLVEQAAKRGSKFNFWVALSRMLWIEEGKLSREVYLEVWAWAERKFLTAKQDFARCLVGALNRKVA